MEAYSRAELNDCIRQLDKITNTLSRKLLPTNFREVLGWSAFLWTACPPYRQAIIRGASYFMTEVEVTAAKGVEGAVSEIQQARQLLNRNFASTDVAMKALLEAMGLGGCCVYLHLPFVRDLYCDCGTTMPVYSAMKDNGIVFDLSDGKYKGKCVNCGRHRMFTLKERRFRDEAHRAKLRIFPLSICRMKYDPISGNRTLFVNCRQWDDVWKLVQAGDPLIHKETPSEFIESARQNEELELDENSFFYLGFSDVSMIDMNLGGWSLPPFFFAFPDVLALLLLQNYNTTILSDYIIPMRYVSPPPTVGAARNMGDEGRGFDPTHAMTSSFGDFRSKVASFLTTIKEDPSLIGISPYPLQFGYLGLEGSRMMAVELMQWYTDSLLSDMGIPPELYRGGINAQVATPSHYGFALFERSWSGLTSNVNRMYQWLTDQLQKSERWPKLYANLVPPVRHADPGMLPILHQRVQEGEFSNDSFNRSIGAHTDYERRVAEAEQMERESRFLNADRQKRRGEMIEAMFGEASPDLQAYSQLQQQAQEQQMQQAQGAAAPAGQAPAGPAPTAESMTAPGGTPGAATSPAEQAVVSRLMERAGQAAQQLLTMPLNERAQMLRIMDAQQPAFRGMVEQQLQDMEGQARQQGLASARGQAPQG